MMVRIGLLSDTHGYFDPRIAEHFNTCHEIWHAGDIGDQVVVERLNRLAPVVAVRGNIDGYPIRSMFPSHQRHTREGVVILMTHIGGYPGNYDPKVKPLIYKDPPDLFISGHSHILKVIPDQQIGLLHMNPGAAGRFGLHKIRTLLRFELNSGKIENVDVIELGSRSAG